jgi:hypothetical protein
METLPESSNHRPGEPLRAWDPSNPHAVVGINLVLQAAQAEEALIRLVNGDPLSVEDQLTFGRLNSWCVNQWWEPLVLLVGRPRIGAEHVQFLRDHADAFRTPT